MTLQTSTQTKHLTAPRPAAPLVQDRETLVLSHLYKVKYIADRMAAKLPTSIERDDLYGAGVVGLLDAVERFEPARGVAFTTFAEMRVRGAILDSLRQLDWASRAARRRSRQVQAAYQNIENERGRPASAEEVARALKISLRHLQEMLGEVRALNVTELDAPSANDDCQTPDRVFDRADSPLERYEIRERSQLLARAVEKLPRRERQVVALYYVEELTMKQIGARLGVTESRVSQLRAQALDRLRGSLSH